MSREIVKINGSNVAVAKTPASWREAVAYFIASQDVKESSRSLYAREIKLFFEWAENTGRNINELSRLDVLTYKDELLGQGMSSLTVSGYITALRKFYAWAESEKLCFNIAQGVKLPRRKQAFKKQHLTDNKSEQLLDYFRHDTKRNYAIVNLCLRCGLRTVEVIRLNIEDITFKGDRRILRVWGKGHNEKDDFVVLSEKAFEPIKDYLQSERKGAKSGEPLFVSDSNRNNGGRLTTRSISRLCKEGLKKIGLDGREFTAHSLRHTTAVAILKHGGDISQAQAVLRHTNPATTQIYTESIKEELRLEQAPELLLDSAF